MFSLRVKLLSLIEIKTLHHISLQQLFVWWFVNNHPNSVPAFLYPSDSTPSLHSLLDCLVSQLHTNMEHYTSTNAASVQCNEDHASCQETKWFLAYVCYMHKWNEGDFYWVIDASNQNAIWFEYQMQFFSSVYVTRWNICYMICDLTTLLRKWIT